MAITAPQLEESAIAQLDLGPQPIIFEKPKEKIYKHLKGLYLKGLIDDKPVNRMLVDTDAVVNLMPYSVLHRLGRSAADLIKTNVMLNDFNGQPSETKGVLNVELTVGRKTVPTSFFIINSKSSTQCYLGGIRFTPIVVFLPQCTSVWFNGMATKWRWFVQMTPARFRSQT